MEYLQYSITGLVARVMSTCFKPYYKWNTFNTIIIRKNRRIIWSFKPYYKWNTFNTTIDFKLTKDQIQVLNLIINGIPSIHPCLLDLLSFCLYRFKPYYKWNTFNTSNRHHGFSVHNGVLNLIINGIPSIQKRIN